MGIAPIAFASALGDIEITNKDLVDIVGDFDEKQAEKTLIEKKRVRPEDLAGLTLHGKKSVLFDNWARLVTHIGKRFYLSSGKGVEDLAYEASEKVIQRAGINPNDISWIDFHTFTQSENIPDPATDLAKRLGITAPGETKLNACVSSVYGLEDARQKLASRKDYKYVLVVCGEVLSRIIDKSSKERVLFGDGAGAAIVGYTEDGGILPAYQCAKPSRNIIYPNSGILLQNDGGFVPKTYLKLMAGTEVLKIGSREMVEAAYKTMESNGLALGDVAYIAPHQANGRMTELVKREFQKTVVWDAISDIGNTSGASLFIITDMILRGEIAGCSIKPGDLGIYTAVAGGYKAGAVPVIVPRILIENMARAG